MTAEPLGPLPGFSPGAGAELAADAEEPWWPPDDREPSEAELCGAWPDPFAGPPDVQTCRLFWAAADGGELPDGGHGESIADAGPLDALAPDPVLAGLVQDALDAGLERRSDDELVGLLRAARRLTSWQAGVELAVVGELDARRRAQAVRPGWSRVSEHVSDELAAALTLTGRSADELLGLARELARIPTVLTALLAGRIDPARA